MLWGALFREEGVPLNQLPYFFDNEHSRPKKLVEVPRLRHCRSGTAGHPVLDVPSQCREVRHMDILTLTRESVNESRLAHCAPRGRCGIVGRIGVNVTPITLQHRAPSFKDNHTYHFFSHKGSNDDKDNDDDNDDKNCSRHGSIPPHSGGCVGDRWSPVRRRGGNNNDRRRTRRARLGQPVTLDEERYKQPCL